MIAMVLREVLQDFALGDLPDNIYPFHFGQLRTADAALSHVRRILAPLIDGVP